MQPPRFPSSPRRSKRRRTSVVVCLLALTATTAAGCGADEGGGGGGGDGVKMGFIVDKTGPLAPIGNGYARGVEIAVEQWNAKPDNPKVQLDSCDSQSTGDGAISCYQKLRTSVDAISGPSLFVGLAAVRGVAAKGTVPLVSGAPLVDPPQGSPLFQSIPTIDDGVGAAYQHFQADGITRVATLTSNDEPGNLAKRAATGLAGQHDIELTAQEVFDPTAQNLAAQAETIRRSNPDAILAWTAGPQLITALRALHAARVNVPIMLNYASMSSALLAKAGEAATGNLLFFGTAAFDPQGIEDAKWKARVEDFDKRFEAKFKAKPDLTAYDAADTLLAIGEAARDADGPEEMRKALESGKPLAGILFSPMKFGPDQHIGVTGADVFDILRWRPADKRWELVG